MDLPINPAEPLIMHIDLDSCFATIEQQANPLLRGKPLAVAAYDTPFGAILSPSIEAKKYGIKTCMRIQEARLLCPRLIIRIPDAPKYRDVHQRFMKIFRDYSPEVTAKSIDEAIIDFTCFCISKSTERLSPASSDLALIAKQIKCRMRSEIGEWISCSIGIGTNRFWAKTGASFNKPDGLVIITHQNIRDIFKHLKLTDLHGINIRYQLRLNRNGIYTPLQFLESPLVKLQKQVFQSIGGYYWYMRLRGWEIDQTEFGRKSYGQQYHLTESTDNRTELLKLLMKLCEKMGRRLREANCFAKGVHVAFSYRDKTYWHHGQTFSEELYTTYDLYQKAKIILQQSPGFYGFEEENNSEIMEEKRSWINQDDEKKIEEKIVTKLAISCFGLQPANFFQDDLFDEKKSKRLKISKALDEINDTYGEYVIHPALMMKMKNKVMDRVAFGKAGIEK